MTGGSKIATFVRTLEGYRGVARLYKVVPRLEVTDWNGNVKQSADFVVVSAADVPFSGPETYIFPGDEEGNVIDWGELDGSFKGALDHEQALRGAGYEIVDVVVITDGLRRLVVKGEHGYIETPSYREVVETFGEVLAETNWGSYQGDSLYLVKEGGRFGILTFGWGSCSGCDALAACGSQEDVDRLQDDLHRGIRWHDSASEALADLDGQWAADSYLDDEMIASFRDSINAATSIVVSESTSRKAVES